ncbi:hypothetical protein TrRE_jg9484, partial [Triparma retinervis]
MLSSSSPTPPNYFRRAYGDGSQDNGTASGRDFLRRQQKWRLKKKQSTDQSHVYMWHGRKITIVKKKNTTRGSGLSAIRSLSSKVDPTPALSPLKIDVSEPPPTTEEPPTTKSHADEEPLSPIKTDLVASVSPRDGLLYADSKPIRLMLQPGTEAVELMPKGDYFLVTSILRDDPPPEEELTAPAAPSAPSPTPPASPSRLVEEEEGPTTYAFSSIAHPSTSTPTSTPIFSHSSPSLSTLSDCDTVYKAFQYAVREYPSNNCLGSLSPASPPTVSFTSYSDTATLINTVATAFHDLSLVEPNEEG